MNIYKRIKLILLITTITILMQIKLAKCNFVQSLTDIVTKINIRVMWILDYWYFQFVSYLC